MTVTIKHVAEAAGVAPSTVSRVMNGSGRVGEQTRQRVEEIARRMGYVPSPAARTLITGRTSSIGLVVPDIANPYFAALIKGAQAQTRADGLTLFIADSDADADLERQLVETMAAAHDGVILSVTPTPDADEHVLALARKTRLVVVNREITGVPGVLVDHRDGLRQTVEHLTALGHRRLAYLGNQPTSWANRQRQEILAGETARLGLELVVLGPYATTVQGGAAAADSVLASGVTAVIAFNDFVAAGVLGRLRDRGVDVPGTLSVVGVDDVPFASLTSPPLTTVRVDTHLLGRRAVRLFLLEDEDLAAVRMHVGSELVVRESTGPAPVAVR